MEDRCVEWNNLGRIEVQWCSGDVLPLRSNISFANHCIGLLHKFAPFHKTFLSKTLF